MSVQYIWKNTLVGLTPHGVRQHSHVLNYANLQTLNGHTPQPLHTAIIICWHIPINWSLSTLPRCSLAVYGSESAGKILTTPFWILRGHKGKQRSFILLITQQSKPSPFSVHVRMCLWSLQLEWKLQTQTLVIQLWDNKAQSPEGYLDTENIQNNLGEARQKTKKRNKNRRQREMREKAKRKVTMTVFMCFMYSVYCLYSPSREGCLCDLWEQHAAWWNSATTTWQMRAYATCFHGAGLLGMGF